MFNSMRRVSSSTPFRALQQLQNSAAATPIPKCRLSTSTAWAPCGLVSNVFVSSYKGVMGMSRTLTTQQVRKYSPTAGQTMTNSANPCWNCKQHGGLKQHMLCNVCGHLQDVDAQINYFELLNFPMKFALKPQDLTRRFRQLQTLVHPDKYSNKTEREQTNSADWSALINKAYKTLGTPLERGQYMLHLQGIQMPQDNSVLDKQFLMEMMERNEEVDEATTQVALEELNTRIAEELEANAEELSGQFDTNALEAAKMLLVKMKYLASIQKTIKNKIQRLLGS